MEEGNSLNRQSCAACRYQRRKCSKDSCVLYPYFPASVPEKFSAALTVFGVSNMTKMIRKASSGEQRDRIAKSLLWEAQAWKLNPTDGPLGLYEALKQVNEQLKELVNRGRQQAVPPGEVVANYDGANRDGEIFSLPAGATGCSDLAVQNMDGYSSSLCPLPQEVRRESVSRGNGNQLAHKQGNDSQIVVSPNGSMAPALQRIIHEEESRVALFNGSSSGHAYRGKTFSKTNIMNAQQNRSQEFSQSFGSPNIMNAQQNGCREFSSSGLEASTSQAKGLSLLQQPNYSWNLEQFGSQMRPLYQLPGSQEQSAPPYFPIPQRQQATVERNQKVLRNAPGNYQVPGFDQIHSGTSNPYFMHGPESLMMNQLAKFHGPTSNTLPAPNMVTERSGVSSCGEANHVSRHPNHNNDQHDCSSVQARFPANDSETNSIQYLYGSSSATPGLLSEMKPIPKQAVKDQATPELMCTQGNSFASMHYSSTSQEEQTRLPSDRTAAGCENGNPIEVLASTWH